MTEKGNSLDDKFLDGEFFAKLYCREIGVVPDKDSAFAKYADLGNCHSYMEIRYKIKGEYFCESIGPMDVFNLISKHLLKLPAQWKPTR